MHFALFTAKMIKADRSTYQNQCISHPKDFMAYTSYLWALYSWSFHTPFLSIKLRQIIGQSVAFRIPLFLNVFTGLGFYLYLHVGSIKAIFTPRLSKDDYSIHQTLDNLQYRNNIKDYLFYTISMNDKKISDAAFAKLKADSTWENQIHENLESGIDDFFLITMHHFLSIYTVKNTQKLIEPFGKSLDRLGLYFISYSASKHYLYRSWLVCT